VSSALADELSDIKGESGVFTAIGPEAMQWLADGTCSITSNMDGTVKISGKTTAYSNVDIISLTVYLQKKVGNWISQGSWIGIDIDFCGEFEDDTLHPDTTKVKIINIIILFHTIETSFGKFILLWGLFIRPGVQERVEVLIHRL